MSKVLIVDDSATMRKILMRAVRQAGVECEGFVEAGNGAEGLERLAQETDIRLVLSDVNMPVMNGIEFLKAVRGQADKQSLAILMVTTEGGEAMITTAREAGASGYITKPFTPESIQAALAGVPK